MTLDDKASNQRYFFTHLSAGKGEIAEAFDELHSALSAAQDEPPAKRHGIESVINVLKEQLAILNHLYP